MSSSIELIYACEVSESRPKWFVFVPDPSKLDRLTRSEGWCLKDIPLPKMKNQTHIVHFIRIADTPLCYSFFPGLATITNSIIDYAIGPPINFMLSEIAPYTRFIGGSDNLTILHPNVDMFAGQRKD